MLVTLVRRFASGASSQTEVYVVHHTHTPRSRNGCAAPLEHEREAWCLFAACTQGTFVNLPGVNFDSDEQGCVFAWKVMRCGCVAVAGPLLGAA